MILIRRATTVLGLFILGLLVPSHAQDRPQVDPFADQILRRMSESLKAAGTFSFHNDALLDEVTASGQKIQLAQSIDVVVRRPDRLWATMRGDLGPRRIWFDGKVFTLLDLGKGFFGQVAVTGSVDAALDQMMQQYGVLMPMADLAFSDPYRALTEQVQTGSYLGVSTVEGVECHHLAFTQETIDWQIWIATGYPIVPCKVVITYKQEAGAPQYIGRLSRWDLAAAAPDFLFRFDPPAGAREVDFMKAPDEPGG